MLFHSAGMGEAQLLLTAEGSRRSPVQCVATTRRPPRRPARGAGGKPLRVRGGAAGGGAHRRHRRLPELAAVGGRTRALPATRCAARGVRLRTPCGVAGGFELPRRFGRRFRCRLRVAAGAGGRRAIGKPVAPGRRPADPVHEWNDRPAQGRRDQPPRHDGPGDDGQRRRPALSWLRLDLLVAALSHGRHRPDARHADARRHGVRGRRFPAGRAGGDHVARAVGQRHAGPGLDRRGDR